jgi:hypothetical protein
MTSPTKRFFLLVVDFELSLDDDVIDDFGTRRSTAFFTGYNRKYLLRPNVSLAEATRWLLLWMEYTDLHENRVTRVFSADRSASKIVDI